MRGILLFSEAKISLRKLKLSKIFFFLMEVLNTFQSLGTQEAKEVMYKQNENINSNMKYKNESDIPKLKRQLKI